MVLGSSRSKKKPGTKSPTSQKKFRRQSLEEIAKVRQDQQPKSAFDGPPTKSPIYDKKQRSKSNLEKGPKDEPKTGDAVVNKTTKKTSIVQACTEKFSANISASANKEYEDYRPVVALLEKCKTDEEEEVPVSCNCPCARCP